MSRAYRPPDLLLLSKLSQATMGTEPEIKRASHLYCPEQSCCTAAEVLLLVLSHLAGHASWVAFAAPQQLSGQHEPEAALQTSQLHKIQDTDEQTAYTFFKNSTLAVFLELKSIHDTSRCTSDNANFASKSTSGAAHGPDVTGNLLLKTTNQKLCTDLLD